MSGTLTRPGGVCADCGRTIDRRAVRCQACHLRRNPGKLTPATAEQRRNATLRAVLALLPRVVQLAAAGGKPAVLAGLAGDESDAARLVRAAVEGGRDARD